MMEDCAKEELNSGCFGLNIYEKNNLSFSTDCKSSISKTNCKLKDETSSPVDNGKNGEKLEKACRKPSIEIKLYKRRFVMMLLFACTSMMNGVPQFQYTVVADIVACYYGVNLSSVNWTCVVYMVAFLPLVFPVMYLMDKKGLRTTLLIGGFLNCMGGWIQCFSFSPNRYAIIMTSQTIYAFGQVLVLSLPPFVAGVWFGSGEVGLACALGVFGNQLGIALGFIIPPLAMTNDCSDQVDISFELSLIAYPLAVINTVLLLIIYLVFQEKPDVFPSISQATKVKDGDYGASLKKLFKDVPFMLLFVAYGLLTGTYFAMSTLMNEMVLIHFPGEEIDAGWMGALMVFAGMAGSILLGSAVDRTHRFKEISMMSFILSLVFMVAYTILIRVDTVIWIQFLFFTLLGFIMTGYLPVGFDFAAEITYPESEAMSASLLNASTQIFSIVETIIGEALLEGYGDIASNVFFCSCLFLGLIITACIKCELKRTNASEGK